MIKKIFKYLSYLLLGLILVFILLLVFPKGSLETQLRNSNVPAIGYSIIKNGKILESKVIGELELGVKAPQDAIFNVASVTKPVFATMVMNLVDEGIIELDEPLYPYWVDPDIESDERHKKLTVRILLSHQSGFPNWRRYNEDKKLSFWFDPGTKYHYSGEGMEYLKKALENKTGNSLLQLMNTYIFNSIGMHSSRMIWDSLLHERKLAKYHNKKGGLYQIWKRKEPVASDDLCTTPVDLAKFALHIINNRGGLSDSIYNEMVRINTDINGRTGYGLGWKIVPDLPNGEYALVHDGSDQGVRARILILPNSKSGFVAFVNGDNGQRIIDRLMVERLEHGGKILDKIYSPIIWRIIYLPLILPL